MEQNNSTEVSIHTLTATSEVNIYEGIHINPIIIFPIRGRVFHLPFQQFVVCSQHAYQKNGEIPIDQSPTTSWRHETHRNPLIADLAVVPIVVIRGSKTTATTGVVSVVKAVTMAIITGGARTTGG